MIRAIIECELVYPFNQSMGTLCEFCALWECTLLLGGTRKPKAIISMTQRYFKRLFKMNPQVGIYAVPTKMQRFISTLKVRKVLVK